MLPQISDLLTNVSENDRSDWLLLEVLFVSPDLRVAKQREQ